MPDAAHADTLYAREKPSNDRGVHGKPIPDSAVIEQVRAAT